MSKDSYSPVLAPSWRDIPQRVKPRAMSREGRRRLTRKGMARIGGLAALALVAWIAWQVAAWQNRPMPAGAGGTAIGDRIVLSTDGVLGRAWLVRTLALPKSATLLGLDLMQLRTRLLASGQVRSAELLRDFPATLQVRLAERSPVARLMAQDGAGSPKPLLVAADGSVYDGAGYAPGRIAALPWLDGVDLRRSGAGFAPIDGMPAVAALLSRAREETASIYKGWQVVSLARLASDGVIEVRSNDGLKVVFGTQEDYFKQLARLDLLLDAARSRPDRPVRAIDLSIGSEVPVTFGNAADSGSEASAAPAAAPASPVFFSALTHPSE